MATFNPRLTKPEKGNKYYITKANGGYSNAIKGKPTDADCDVLSNCVGYAYGRFNEIGGYGSCKYLSPVNAENFIQYKGDLEVGQTPKLGACMVWRKGATLSNSDGAGHVAIVEKIISDTQIVTSESGWNSKAFWTKTRNKGNGNWDGGSGYTFLGFIYNPAPCCGGTVTTGTTTTTTKPTTTEKTETTPTYTVGKLYKTQVDQLSVRVGAGTNNARKTYAQLTPNAKENAYSTGHLKKGVAVTCLEVKKVGSNIWIRIPSGWCAAYYNGKYYIK